MKSSAVKNGFILGDQPVWAGMEANHEFEDTNAALDFIETVIQEDSNVSLLTRGYAIIPLEQDTYETYNLFHTAFEQFSHQDLRQKSLVALQQFDHQDFSPNQYHGFSMVDGLKEQWMMRCAGQGNELLTPGAIGNGPSMAECLSCI